MLAACSELFEESIPSSRAKWSLNARSCDTFSSPALQQIHRLYYTALLLVLYLLQSESFVEQRSFHLQRNSRLAFAVYSSPTASPDDYISNVLQPEDGNTRQPPLERPPIPVMPSSMFQRMALSQLELLANSLTSPGNPSSSKVESMALYLPQENVLTGQLEFTPVVLYPDPNTERVFIASDSASGQAPTLPPTLTKLPGFAHATTLLPGYPMMSSDQDNPGVGVVEEVMCDARFKNKPAALSVPLLSGSQTVGVLLVSPSLGPNPDKGNVWTELDREQVSRAAQSLSMALSMDNERNALREQNNAFREGLSDSLHQVKNPLQALRTYGKILQRQIVSTSELGSGTPALLELTERMMVQSERVVDLMVPMDTLIENLEQSTRIALQPAKAEKPRSLIVRSEPLQLLPWENETLDFARDNDSHISPATKIEKQKQKLSKTMPTVVVGDLDLEMTFVDEILESTLAAFSAIASERGIKFDIIEQKDELPGVMAAPKAIEEAICNILDNAFKYVTLPKKGSPFSKNPSPCVRIRMTAATVEAGVSIIIEDNGPGIEDCEKETIFQRGYRGQRTKEVDGSGIGLDISRSLVEGMGGTLEVADTLENTLDGTVIICTLLRRPRTE